MSYADITEQGYRRVHRATPLLKFWSGIVAFVLFVVSLLAAMSFSSRGKAPVVGEYHDPSQLPADEQAMLDSVHAAPRH